MGDTERTTEQATRDIVANPEALRAFNAGLVEDFRANGGKITTGPLAGWPVIILSITGAKSGSSLTIPLVHTDDNGRLVIIASYGGKPDNPAWYHNLKANPLAMAEVGTERFEIQATEVYGAERDRLYDAQAALMPVFKDYAAKTDRTIPVFVLDRT